jgi:ADP-ribosyl-[dinitrogen reductase] hydrolase
MTQTAPRSRPIATAGATAAGQTAPADPAVLDRALGALVGLAVGDALGTTIEFKQRDTYHPVTGMVGGGPFRLKPGEWTDDTAMALCLADSLIASGGVLDPRDLASRFVRWWDKGENSVNGYCFDIGIATSQALHGFKTTGQPTGSTDPRSAGNGGIMRLAPAVLAARGDRDRAVDLARLQSLVTHAAAECLDAADALARVLHAGIAGEGGTALDAAAQAGVPSAKIHAIAQGSWRGKSRPSIRSGGYVVDTLEAALWAVGTSGDFAEAVLKAVNLGHDADTVGAVAGQVAGAVWGYDAIPQEWRATLAWHDAIVARGRRLWGVDVQGEV